MLLIINNLALGLSSKQFSRAKQEIIERIIKKEQTSYSDLLDALRLVLKGYNIK
jgi:hypothetical protein